MGADTAKLLASLDLQDAMSPKLKTAVGNVSAAEGAVGRLGTGLSNFSAKLSGGVSNAISTFGGRLKQLGAGFAAAFGIGGLLSIGGVLTGSITKLEEFSLALEKVQTLTGETAKDSGTLILLFEKFGLSLDQVGTFAGFAEKTLGKLAQATAKSGAATKSAALIQLEHQKLLRQAAGLSTTRINQLIAEQKATDALSRSLANAADGTTKLQALDKQYGLHLIDAAGKTVSFSEELRQLADFYDRNHDAAQRAFVASTLLGRGYAALAPILSQGSAAIREAANEADALGLNSQGTADRIIAFRTQMRNLGVQANVLQLQIGEALIPTISHFAADISNFITNHRTDIVKFFENAGTAAEHLAGVIGDVIGTISGFWNSIPAGMRDLLIKGFVADRTVHFLFGFGATDIAKTLLGGLGGSLLSRGSPTNPMWVQMTGLGAGTGGLGGMGLLQALGIGTAILAVGYAVGEGIFAFLGGKKVGDPNYNPAGTPIGGTPFRIGAAQPYYKDPATGLPYRQTPSTFVNHTDALQSVKPALNELGMAAMNLAGAGVFLTHAMHNAATKLAERLQHSVLPKSEVNAQLRAALRIANSSESTGKKIAGLEAIEKDLRTHGHSTSRYVAALLDVERHKKTQFTAKNYITIPIRVGTATRIYRVSSTTYASDSMTNSPIGGGGIKTNQ